MLQPSPKASSTVAVVNAEAGGGGSTVMMWLFKAVEIHCLLCPKVLDVKTISKDLECAAFVKHPINFCLLDRRPEFCFCPKRTTFKSLLLTQLCGSRAEISTIYIWGLNSKSQTLRG